MALTFAEDLYSFRSNYSVYAGWHQPQSPQEAALAAIEAKLLSAHNLYLARRYAEALQAYFEARELIYAQLNAGFAPSASAKHRAAALASTLSKAQMFEPLLSAAAEWLNVLPVHQPVSPVQPRRSVDAGLLEDVPAAAQSGLASEYLTRPTAAQAIASFRAAQVFSAQGNTEASRFFAERARGVDERTFTLLATDEVVAPATAGAPASARALADAVEPVIGEALSMPKMTMPNALRSERRFTIATPDGPRTIRWSSGGAPDTAELREALYEVRLRTQDLNLLAYRAYQPADLAGRLPHDYYYVVPLGLAETYHALGDFANAERYYFSAASYTFLNADVEAPYVWLRLVQLYSDWGDSLYREDDAAAAAEIYQKVLTFDGEVPAGPLFDTAALKPGADAGRQTIANLAALIDGTTTADALGLNPLVVATIAAVRAQLTKIAGGLDFWGHATSTVPIWTFDYLQNAAVNFTQLAIGAEKDFIDFQDRADQSRLTREQLAQSVTQSIAEREATKLDVRAANAEVEAFESAVTLANQRATDAVDSANEYAAASNLAIQFQAVSAQMSGGDDGNIGQLNANADAMLGIGPAAEYLRQGYKLTGSAATLSAAAQLAGARMNRDYEVASLQRQAGQMQLAAAQAQADLKAAKARAAAARAHQLVADLRAASAKKLLQTFDAQFFTPDVWHRLGQTMWALYQRYLTMAVRTAKLMQQAFNFETDQALRLIKGDYSAASAKGLLGAETLMADIQSFTYNLITSKAGKPQPLRQTISLAQSFPLAFENELRKTGRMAFETRVEDFDCLYPGTYAGRIESVQVDVEGIVPVFGLSGALTNNGISLYRTPAFLGPDDEGAGVKFRVQSKETLVLSDYKPEQDAMRLERDRRMLGVFQGAGVASSWVLELPKEINDIDYGALTDVRLTFYYKARFDPDLRGKVLAQLAALPALNQRMRALPVRWIYPDAFFRFQDTGVLKIALSRADFRHNETDPQLTSLGVVVTTDGSRPAADIVVRFTRPSNASATATTDTNGRIEAVPGSPWAPLATGSALGEYIIEVRAADNPTWVVSGALNVASIANIALVIGYSYTPRA